MASGVNGHDWLRATRRLRDRRRRPAHWRALSRWRSGARSA